MSLDRARAPRLAAVAAPTLPRLVSRRLANGLAVHVVEMRKAPVVDVTLLVHAGAVQDPDDLPGLATFTAGMLDEGAGARTAFEIADEIDFLGASLTTSAGVEMAQVNLHVPVGRWADALEVLADVALAPAFPAEEIARQRELRLSHLLQLRDQPSSIAPLAFNAIVYAGHPYGRPAGGTEASTERLDPDRVLAFYTACYRPRNASLLVVGDVSPDDAVARLTPRFGAWRDDVFPAPPEPPAPRRAPRALHIVDKPGAPQSVIRVGNVGTTRTAPDYETIQVLNTLLGGSFSSRLNQNLRETHGFTYGASSAFELRRLAGPFRAGASVATDVTARAVAEFLNELRRIREAPVAAEELELAKRYLALSLPGDFETTSSAGQKFTELLANDVPADAWDAFSARVAAVTAADVQRVARATIDTDHLAIVVVGDRRVIEPELAALGEGPVDERDLWGAPVTR